MRSFVVKLEINYPEKDFICLFTLDYAFLMLNLHIPNLQPLTHNQKNRLLITVILFLTALPGYCEGMPTPYGQEEMIEYRGTVRASFAGGENTPFWLVGNIHGLGSPEFNNGYVRGEIYKRMNSEARFSWGVGADLTGAWNLPAAFGVRQLFGEIHYRALWASIGSRNYESNYNNPRLSTGDLLFSGNSMAIPQIRIGTNGFAPFWGTRGWFSVKSYLAYGFFTDSRWQQSWVVKGADRTSDVLFCSRGLWLRGGNFEKFPLTFDVGIEMGTQFGGTIYKDGHKIKMPKGFDAWMKAIIPMAGDKSTPKDEQTNVQGNMTGEYSISVAYSPASGWLIRPYWEHYFEDHSQMTFEYGLWKDGLYGIEISFPKNPIISTFVYEYIGTKDQTGSVNHNYTPEIPEQASGGDNYFNHYLYGSWQNWGMSIGTPLAISPLYNRDHRLRIYNTRFIANHVGFEGNPIEGIDWRLLLTFSRNWGSYHYPLQDVYTNWSGLAEISYQPSWAKGWKAIGALAWDRGKLLGNNFGGMISLSYEGNFSIKKK